MTAHRLARAVVAACLLLISARATAQDTAPAAGYHRHDGMFLRVALGGGWLGISESTAASELKATGTGSGMAGALGFAVAENVIVFVEASVLESMDPSATVNGVATARPARDLTLSGFGPGIAYYFEPTNVFVSAAITFCSLDMFDDGANALTATRRGIGLGVTGGKEWWISTNWALGVGLQLQYGRMTDRAPDPSPAVSASAISLLGTATFN